MIDSILSIEFAKPWAFMLLVLPLFVYVLVPRAKPIGGALRVPFFDRLSDHRQAVSGRVDWPRRLVLSAIWLLLVIACARPQMLDDARGVPVSGRDLMMAVDVSGSMKTRDMFDGDRPENRLSTVKRLAGQFIERRIGDRIGLILFGSRAYLQAPLSLDRITVNQLLQEAAIGIAGEKTAIGDAIGLAMKRLDGRPGDQRLLILLTDGTNTAGTIEPLQAARLAELGGLRIHTIGVGGNRERTSGTFGGTFFGQRGDLDEATLQQIAEQTGGRYFRATDSSSLAKIYSLIDALEPVEELEENLRPKRELYPWPLGAALLISFVFALMMSAPVSAAGSATRRNGGAGTAIRHSGSGATS